MEVVGREEFVSLNEEQTKRINELANEFLGIYAKIKVLCKNSRETSLGLTKLEEAQMWLTKGISREGKTYGE